MTTPQGRGGRGPGRGKDLQEPQVQPQPAQAPVRQGSRPISKITPKKRLRCNTSFLGTSAAGLYVEQILVAFSY